MGAFRPVDPKARFPDVEERILAFWKREDIFRKSLELRKGAPEWVFYEGPPTANGRPGIHHVPTRTFKDVYPRFRAMSGYSVPRKAGWDCHGLPVELEVEKEIGTKTKSDIEAFGIGEFTRLCRESVTRYVHDWERLTERIGFWLDMSDAYWTMDTSYVESVWWSLKGLWERGLLTEDHKVTAYCPRCGTALSDAEVALGYEETDDPSVFLKLEITEAPDPDLVGAKIAVWTTTPWTLISNLGLAVDPDSPYVEVDYEGDRLLIAGPLLEKVLPEASPSRNWRATDLVGARYTPPFENVEESSTHKVVAGDFVSMDEGTGVVHIAPAFGADDLEIGRSHKWPVFNPVDGEGKFTDEAPEFARGKFVKDADDEIMADLERRGLLIRRETYRHSYPFCWRCSTPLLYYARTSWYIRTSQVKDRMLQVNEEVNWYPKHIKHGRYGNWLENNVDWALSRDRYWGTPLPVWRCAQKHTTVIGSLEELGRLAGRDVSEVDPHRPAIDEITITCPECSQEARRVPEVIDTWYDSGAMPFAQWGYPHKDGSKELFDRRFPADFISEAIDQTRGWFYTLMAEGVLHFDSTAYRNVVCLGLIVDAEGRKMSKSLGNVIDPWDVLDRHGADALRWYLLTGGSPWASRRISMEILDESVRQFLLTLWNVYAFFVTYADADDFDPETAEEVPLDERPPLDRWLLSQLNSTVDAAGAGLESYDATSAGRRIQGFVDDLSNWYVRRARRRFWNPAGEGGRDSTAAFWTLHESLVTLARLLAPFVPFVSEEIWLTLAAGKSGAPESVHLSDYPKNEPRRIDPKLDESMQTVRDIIELGRRVRNDAKVKVRQPLARAAVHFPGERTLVESLLALVKEELNVKEVVFSDSAEQLSGWRARPNFKALGPKLGARVKSVAAVLDADDGSIASAIAGGDTFSVELDGEVVTLGPGDLDLTRKGEAGWGVAAEGGLTVALDLEPTRELRLEGLAREIVRLIQDARRSAGLEVTDRIDLAIEASGDLANAAASHGDYIAGETLSKSVSDRATSEFEHREEADIEDQPIVVAIRRA
ncbi:MAG: isoleucine--tRNA ligase [Actinomycetota bacterium]